MEYDILIIGGGIVGLATAWRILEKQPSARVCILEKEKGLAAHQTGNNSGVIHSGIYYKPNSLKALNCIRGYQMMLDFCMQHEIPHEVCGKIIVATRQDELPRLQALGERAQLNGLTGVRKISPSEMKEIEPHVSGIEGLWVPQTGIVDYRLVADKLGQLIRNQGGEIHLNTQVKDINHLHQHSEVITENRTFTARLIVNCAGLYSDKIAELTRENISYRIIPFRGEYYKLRPERENLVKNLIYPVPDPNFPFLGVHFTRMKRGGVEAGPNAVLAFRREGYRKSDFDRQEFMEIMAWRGFQKVAAKYWKMGMGEFYRSFSKAAFTRALQRLIPAIQENDLVEGGAGIRAQACDREGGLIDDFLILEDRYMINIGNAPSPAATSSLSIGQTVSEMVLKRK
jgi:(S)-2-hydroxyglutarate dehydrogenase